MKLRIFIFWIHLIVGVTFGALILSMSVTGMILAFEPQIVAFAERSVRVVAAPETVAEKLDLNSLLLKAREMQPRAKLSGVSVKSDKTASVSFSFGKEGGAVYVNPHTGEVLGKGSKIHDAMHWIEDWHRWLGSRDIGKPITGAACFAFLFLVLSGVYLWWPNSVLRFVSGLSGKAWHWNRHNVTGFWCSPLLLITTLTGLLMSYAWANELLYKMTGNTPPPAPIQSPKESGQGQEKNKNQNENRAPDSLNLDVFLKKAEEKAEGWTSIALRLPQKEGAPVNVSIVEANSGANQRSQLTLDPVTAEEKKWEPYREQNLGKRARSWVKPIHTGEAGGLLGQTLAFVAAAGAFMLVWTGFSMAWRRFRRKN